MPWVNIDGSPRKEIPPELRQRLRDQYGDIKFRNPSRKELEDAVRAQEMKYFRDKTIREARYFLSFIVYGMTLFLNVVLTGGGGNGLPHMWLIFTGIAVNIVMGIKMPEKNWSYLVQAAVPLLVLIIMHILGMNAPASN